MACVGWAAAHHQSRAQCPWWAEAHPTMQMTLARARAAFLRACQLDVEVRKPGNVSFASPGHRMHAQQFIAIAEAAQHALFEPGLSVEQRIEDAVTATHAVASCNTYLSIVLLVEPIAAALESN